MTNNTHIVCKHATLSIRCERCDDEQAGAWTMIKYMANASGDQFVTDAYGEDVNPNYRRVKANGWAEDAVNAISKLDLVQRKKFLKAVQAFRWHL